jgi:FAD/FMN-containing dehydrogenase
MIIKSDSDLIQNYLSDASNIKGKADKVFIPEDIDEMNKILKDHNDHKTPITISAGGTGTTGSRVSSKGSILSVEKLNKIISIDQNEETVTVEPGVVGVL